MASSTPADVLERVLDKGVVIAGDIKVKLVDIELLTIQIRLITDALAGALVPMDPQGQALRVLKSQLNYVGDQAADLAIHEGPEGLLQVTGR
ncbi:MAG: gas vesicle protein [Planctomycetota bacterium]|nr:gas vesicle protein [Planctomycetota bacterium]